MTRKDYSLLRPFDLEAAKAGAKVCYGSDGDFESVTFLAEAGPDRIMQFVITKAIAMQSLTMD